MKITKKNTIIIVIIVITIIIIIFCLIFLSSRCDIENYSNDTKSLKNHSVIFAGTVRNCEKYIENTLNNIDKCGNKFKNYCVIIYENDSTDQTREVLNKNKKMNYYYIFEDNVTESRRTMRLENGRNKIIEKVKEMGNEYNYLIMLDMDDVNESGKFVDSIESCFQYDLDTWDILTGNQTNKYYDIWALRKPGLIDYDCWRETNNSDENKQKEIHHIINNTHFEKNGLIEVDSAFSGIAIYKISSIGNCKYVGEYPDKSENCEHVEFNKCIKNNGGKIFINTEFYTS